MRNNAVKEAVKVHMRIWLVAVVLVVWWGATEYYKTTNPEFYVQKVQKAPIIE